MEDTHQLSFKETVMGGGRMQQRSGRGERARGQHRREDLVLWWEIREAFMGEMTFDLNFSGHTAFHR